MRMGEKIIFRNVLELSKRYELQCETDAITLCFVMVMKLLFSLKSRIFQRKDLCVGKVGGRYLAVSTVFDCRLGLNSSGIFFSLSSSEIFALIYNTVFRCSGFILQTIFHTW